MQQQCARPGCSAKAAAVFTFDAREQRVWLDEPRPGAARAGELCERHIRTLTPPRGWLISDRRHAPDDLHSLLDAHTPLLERAFRASGAA